MVQLESYIADLVLCLVPSLLLYTAWKANAAGTLPRWRSGVQTLGLALATLAVASTLVYFVSKTYSGKIPLALWQRGVFTLAGWSWAATIVLGLFAKGKVRWLVLGAMPAFTRHAGSSTAFSKLQAEYGGLPHFPWPSHNS